MTQRTDEDLDKIGASANTSASAIDDLTAAAQRADAAFTGSTITFGRNLSDVIGSVNGALGSGVRFFENRFQTLRQLTDYGINFNYSMEAMETDINKARMTLSQFAGIVRENNQAFVGLGVSVNEGATTFLTSVDQMLNSTVIPGLENEIAKLGYTTDETIEAFLNYQNQLKFSSYGRRRDEAELHRGFLQYTKTLDELSKLTGKERDKLQEDFIDAARRPSVMARNLSLGEDVQGTSDQIIGNITSQFGPEMAKVAEDILGQAGVLQGDNVYAAQFEFTRTLEAIRAAQDRNDRDEVDRLARILPAQIAQVATSSQFRNLSGFQDNPMSQFLDRIVGEMARNPAYLNYQQAQVDLLNRLGRAPTAEEIMDEVDRVISRQTPTRGTGTDDNGNPIRTGQEGYLAFIEGTIEFERRQQTLRQATIDEAYQHFEGVITSLTNTLTTLNRNISTDIQNAQRIVSSIISGLSFDASQLETNITRVQGLAQSLGPEGVRLSGELDSLFDQFNAATNPTEQQALMSSIARTISDIERLDAARTAINANQAQVTITGDGMTISIPGAALPPPAPSGEAGSRTSIGTIGSIGRIFKDYGTETITALHGMEAVLTPDQLSDLVHRSVFSTLYAANDVLGTGFDSSSARVISSAISSGMSGIDGRLNTLRNNVNNLPSMNTNTLEPEQISQIVTSALSSMPRDIRRGFEEALTNTIKTPIEQLVAVNTTNADESTKIRKRIGDMSNNLLS